MYKHILVPVDGSDISKHIFDQAVEIGQYLNIDKMTLLYVYEEHVISTPDHGVIYDVNRRDLAMESAKKKLEELKATAKADFTIETAVVEGDPRSLIGEKYPEDEGVDLIVMGATGKGNLERLLLGSVAQYVAKHAEVDTFLIR